MRMRHGSRARHTVTAVVVEFHDKLVIRQSTEFSSSGFLWSPNNSCFFRKVD